MLALVAPEPADWVERVLEALVDQDQPVVAFAPWAPGGAQGRRVGWGAADVALRAWARRGVDQRMRGRIARRQMVDRLASRHLPADVTRVVAPSLSARRTFAAARPRGVQTVLVEDLPGLRDLHADLDAAAERWPDSSFLRRFRAPAAWIAEQEAERVLAHLLVVTSAHAAAHRASGSRIAGLDLGAGPGPAVTGNDPARRRIGAGPPRRVLLAGPAVARNGTNEALTAIDARPDLALVIRPAEGLEPAALLKHPRVQVATEAEHARLEGIDVVLAPAWCEGRFRQVDLAADLGLPVIATTRASGWVEGHSVEPGRVEQIVSALRGPLQPARRTVPIHQTDQIHLLATTHRRDRASVRGWRW